MTRCHYNFVRPHGALKFGPEIRTPAMQAALAKRRLTFREVFVWPAPCLWVKTVGMAFGALRRTSPLPWGMPVAA